MRIVLQINQNMINNLIKLIEVCLGSGGVIGMFVTIHKWKKGKENKTIKEMQQQIEQLTIAKNAWQIRHDHLKRKRLHS